MLVLWTSISLSRRAALPPKADEEGYDPAKQCEYGDYKPALSRFPKMKPFFDSGSPYGVGARVSEGSSP